MTELYTFISSLNDLSGEIQPDSITSRTFYKGEGLHAILFAFDAEQELSEHTSSKSAILQILEGEAMVTLGSDVHQVSPGAWIQIPPNLKHSIYANTALKLILLMVDVN